MLSSSDTKSRSNLLESDQEEPILRNSIYDESGLLALQTPTEQLCRNQTREEKALDAAEARDGLPRKNISPIQRYLALHSYLERPQEESALREAYHQHKNDPLRPLFLIVTGPPGAGKTTLVQRTLRSLVVDQENGFFITGKFDFLRRPAPYTAFISAFTEFTDMIVARGEDAVDQMRTIILDALGGDLDVACVLTGMIPALERILKASDSRNNNFAPVGDALQRFIFVFQSFMKAICSASHPVVLFLDDLQFADDCSLDLLKSMVTDVNEGLVVVGVHQTNITEVESNDPFISKLRWLENNGSVHVARVVVPNLTEESVAELISNTMRMSSLHAKRLTQIACQQTKLSFFHVKMQILKLIEADILLFDEATGSWYCDEEVLRISMDNARMTESYPEIFLKNQLSDDVLNMLKVAACLGYNFNEKLLEYVLDEPVGHLLETAAMFGVVLENESRNGYMFQHDELQKASYHLIPQAERELFHLEVGRRMWRNLNAEELECCIFELLSQMYFGRRLIIREKECIAVATLCLHAGLRAAKSSTFRTSFLYLEMGISLLDDDVWYKNYELALSLYYASSELALCNNNFARLNTFLDIILLNTKTYIEKIQAFALKIYALGIEGRQLEAIDVGIEVLSHLGMKIPLRFYVPHLITNIRCAKKLLQGKSDEQLLRMPNITNENALACLKILHTIYPNTLTVKPMLTAFIVLKSTILTLKYGLSAFASVAFASYGLICLNAFKDVDSAFRYGKLGVVLLERFHAKEYLPRVYFAYYGCVYAWKKPPNDVLVPLLLGYKIGVQVRDVEAGCFCANFYVFHAYSAGVNLALVHKELREMRETLTSFGFDSLLLFLLPSLQLTEDLMGVSADPLATRGSVLDFDKAIQDGIKRGDVILVMMLHLLRMATAYVLNNYELAAEELSHVPSHSWKMLVVTNRIAFMTTSALVCLSRAREGHSRKKNIRYVVACLKELKSWRSKAASGIVERIFLIEAELASIRNQKTKAIEKYVCAIALMNYHGCTYMAAVANERAARHCWAHSDYEEASHFFDAALMSYQKWGALGKYKELFAEVESLNLSK